MAAGSEEETKKKKGCWHRFTQQQLPAWQPVLTPKGVLIIFYSLATVMLGLGSVILATVSDVVRIQFEYGSVDKNHGATQLEVLDGQNFLDGDVSHVEIVPNSFAKFYDSPAQDTTNTKPDNELKMTYAFQVKLKLKEPIKDQDLYLYYGLEYYHQNIRQYVRSRDFTQLEAGSFGDKWDSRKAATTNGCVDADQHELEVIVEAKNGNRRVLWETAAKEDPDKKKLEEENDGEKVADKRRILTQGSEVPGADEKTEKSYLYPCGLIARTVWQDSYLMEHTSDASDRPEGQRWTELQLGEDITDIGWREMEIGSGRYYQFQPDAGAAEGVPAETVDDLQLTEFQERYYMWLTQIFPPLECRQRHPGAGSLVGFDTKIPPLYVARKTEKYYPANYDKYRRIHPVWDCTDYKRDPNAGTVKGSTDQKLGPFKPDQCRFTPWRDPGVKMLMDQTYRDSIYTCDQHRQGQHALYRNGNQQTPIVPTQTPKARGGVDYYKQEEKRHWGVESGHFINWMHIAGLSTFQKLYGKLRPTPGADKTTVHDTIRLTIYSRTRLESGLNSETDTIRKSVVLSTKSWLGGRNMNLAYAYFVTGGICLLCAFYFTYCYCRYPRTTGDIRDLDWVKHKNK